MSALPVSSARPRASYIHAIEEFMKGAESKGLSHDGAETLVQFLDGFHDVAWTPKDPPTGHAQFTNCTMIPKQLTISKPPDLPAGSTWDCHIALNSVAGGSDGFVGFSNFINGATQTGARFNLFNGTFTQSTSPNEGRRYFDAPVLISRVPGGQDTFGPNAPALSNANLGLGIVDVPSSMRVGPHRIVGIAYEVVNTTPEIYRSGAVTNYRFPAMERDQHVNFWQTMDANTQVYSSSTGANLGPLGNTRNACSQILLTTSMCPPSNLAAANFAKVQTFWDAALGTYVNGVFEYLPDLETPRPRKHAWLETVQSGSGDAYPMGGPAITASGRNVGRPYSSTGAAPLPQCFVSGDAVSADTVPGNFVNQFGLDHSIIPLSPVPVARGGSYFSGLHENTTLDLRVRFFISSVPTPDDPKLFQTAIAPRTGEVLYWEAYSGITKMMPAGCMQNENSLGTWFTTIAKAMGEHAPSIGAALNNIIPGAGIVGNLLGHAGRALTPSENEEVQREKHRQESEPKAPPASSQTVLQAQPQAYFRKPKKGPKKVASAEPVVKL